MQITIEITDSTGAAITVFLPGEEFSITVPSYIPGIPVNMWIHTSAGSIAPADTTTHTTATACAEAGFSNMPAAVHSVTWTAPSIATSITLSVAQAASFSDFYHTVTVLSGPLSDVSCLCVVCNVAQVMLFNLDGRWVLLQICKAKKRQNEN